MSIVVIPHDFNDVSSFSSFLSSYGYDVFVSRSDYFMLDCIGRIEFYNLYYRFLLSAI